MHLLVSPLNWNGIARAHWMSSRLPGVALLLGLFLFSCDRPAWADLSWVTDTRTGVKVGWIIDDSVTLVKASWSGSQVSGLAQGKGALSSTFRDKSGKDFEIQGEVEMVAGLLDGKVNLKWTIGTTFEGYYKAGLRDGRGITKYPGGAVLDFEWKKGKWDGKAIAKYAGGDSFEGETRNNNFSRGIYRWADGTFYDGEWKNGSRHGKGRARSASGSIYEGTFLSGLPVGAGVLKNPQGAVIFSGERRELRDQSMHQF